MDKIYDMLAEIKPEHDFKNSEDYIEDGLLDSFDLITLISMMEDEFHITVDALEIVPENFCNAKAIEELIKKSGGVI